MSEDEKKFLDQYDISRYERPSVTADMAVFAVMGADKVPENYRKDPEKHLKLLMIKRAKHPYKDKWALPGGFCKSGESTAETARRELYEETGVKEAYLKPFDIFSEPGRDPRGWIISHAFLTLINAHEHDIQASSDAREAQWFSVSVDKKEVSKDIREDTACIKNLYSLTLTCGQPEAIRLGAQITQTCRFVNYHENIVYDIAACEGIAFDHAVIILSAFLTLQKEVNENGRPVFDLMPDKFTLAQLQNAFEIVQGKKLLGPNFRRKIAGHVRDTGELLEGAGHRPAKLFRRDLESFYDQPLRMI